MTHRNDPLTRIVVGGSDFNVKVGQFYLTINTLTSIRVPRYHHLKTILSGNQDKIYLAQKEELKVREQNKQTLGYVRGAAYYGGYDDDK